MSIIPYFLHNTYSVLFTFSRETVSSILTTQRPGRLSVWPSTSHLTSISITIIHVAFHISAILGNHHDTHNMKVTHQMYHHIPYPAILHHLVSALSRGVRTLLLLLVQYPRVTPTSSLQMSVHFVHNMIKDMVPPPPTDFTRVLPQHLSLKILGYLDPRSLAQASLVGTARSC